MSTSFSRAKVLAGALAALAAAPALAAPRGYYAPSYYRPAPDNALRLEVGGASISSPGLYCPNGALGGCVNDGPFGWSALSLGGELDLGLGGGPVALTLGARELAAPYDSGAPNVFEPSIGLTFRFLRHQPVQARLGIGAGLMLANDGTTGGAVRFGAGLSLFATGPVGLAIDAVVDVGRLGGYGVTQLQLSAGPEFHF